MGMSTHVVGFHPPDDAWRRMKSVWDSCRAAGVEVPEEVKRFFAWNEPDEAGVCVNLCGSAPAVEPWSKNDSEGFEVDLERLREMFPSLTKIRFYNSW